MMHHHLKTFLLVSLMFERAYRWNGLLVEPNPIIFAKVIVRGQIEWGQVRVNE